MMGKNNYFMWLVLWTMVATIGLCVVCYVESKNKAEFMNKCIELQPVRSCMEAVKKY